MKLAFFLQNDREQAERLADSLLSRPHDYLPIMEDALRDHVANLDAKYMTKHGECRVGIVGPFGWRRCTPRQLLSNRLSQLVRVDGIVTKCSLVRPKIVQSVHYSAHTKQFVSKSYTDITTLTSSVPSGASMPKVDEQGNQLSTEYGLCTYRDHQTIVLQETPEVTARP